MASARTASKKVAKKTTAKKTGAKKRPAANAAGGTLATVRMYRQGLGDCFLIKLPRDNGEPFFILIDCGVILGTPKAQDIMTEVVADIGTVTNHHIDLLIVTHEHWDHLSGFLQAQAEFDKIEIDDVWFAWTEDSKDDLANKLRAEHGKIKMALTAAAARYEMASDWDSSKRVSDLLGFFGAAGQGTTTDALKYVKSKVAKQVFCRPTDPPIIVPGVDAQFFILGPPHDEKMIKRFNPSKANPETYGLDGANRFLLDSLGITGEIDQTGPFDLQFQIPSDVARQMRFFQDHYWGEDPDAKSSEGAREELCPTADQSWRRIDGDWLGVTSDLALQLDSATNNTSLALGIRLASGEVLLFAADAQVGNWLSWQDLSWQVDGETITGPELLAKTQFYKVGHHASHNATLRKFGLEQMTSLKIAMIPVDHDMAVKKRWGNMPFPDLLAALDKATDGFVLRVDQPVPEEHAEKVVVDELYYEVTI
jgi:hypothetical protein